MWIAQEIAVKTAFLLRAAAAVLCFAATPVIARPASAPQLKVERVVMLMRHGIRPPTKPNVVPAGYTNEKWPSWPVDYGLLTPRGAAGVKLLGEADRFYYATRGLFGPGCPDAGSVVLKASGKQRAIRTAESWGEGFMPGCPAAVSHPQDGEADPIFHGLDDQPAWFDGEQARREALALAPKGGIAAEEHAYRRDLLLLAHVLDCALPACQALAAPNRLVAVPHGRPELEGPLDIASTASQTLLLEYLEGMPMKDVGWGRVSRAQIEQLLRFHPLKFRYSNRPDYVARAAAAPIAKEIVMALSGNTKLTLLAGHDTNIADLGGYLKLHWKVPSYPADDVPPGSALGFELVRDRKGDRYVRAFYRAQTMDQLRTLTPLTGKSAPFRQHIPIAECGNSVAATACTWTSFQVLVEQRQPAAP
ncbi:histidine-type phosphatase [Sphingomonas sp. MAH-20]|jgi:4-phytase/acid phosphatase|uniref:Histidine-type phosphatase n=1 Tax=Sphingomonas horti TaxID=2682842 RepID=A0A6I4J9F5_9SPHN|nr:histidine-type phosphatase [Sphingomonas horti]MVO79491.1 histidine-type phosphatase [Sphingomonas horti]